MGEVPKKVCLDTNVLIDGISVEDFEHVIIPIVVLEELDKLKRSPDGDLAYRARKASKMLENASNVEIVFEFSYSLPRYLDYSVNDNKIIGFAKEACTADKDCVFLSNDLNVRLKAKNLGIACRAWGDTNENQRLLNYSGFRTVEMSDEELASFYESNKTNNYFNLCVNEYVLIRNGNEIVDKYKWTENGLKKVSYNDVSSRTMKKVKPVNLEQQLLFDMLQDNKTTIKCSLGGYGTGKDYCMLAHAFNLLETEKVKRIIYIRNTVEVKNSRPVGYLKGTLEDKLMPYAMCMADHIGGRMGLEMLIQSGKVKLQHLGFIRGRNIEDSIIYCSEAENMTKEHIQLLIGRVGSGSILYLNGDIKQTDDKVFEQNNGLYQLVNKFKGQHRFGYVQLSKTERSETAAMADLLD